jgi:hypothetical protein
LVELPSHVFLGLFGFVDGGEEGVDIVFGVLHGGVGHGDDEALFAVDELVEALQRVLGLFVLAEPGDADVLSWYIVRPAFKRCAGGEGWFKVILFELIKEGGRELKTH